MARAIIAAQGVDDATYFTLLDKLARSLGVPMFDCSRRMASLAA